MMVIRADVLGMCAGVRRAESLARKAGATGTEKGKSVYTYGPLIHNPQMLEELEAIGVRVLDPDAFGNGSLDESAAGSIVVIRAHGAPPSVFERLENLRAEVVDATCPRVLRSQERAEKLSGEGWSVVIAGDRAHSEVAGILGHAPEAQVVENEEEAGILAEKWAERRVVLIAQTTIKASEYSAIADRFKERCADFLKVETICPATSDRQRSLSALAEKTQAVIVVGGKNSANTQRLAMAVREAGKPCWHIETPTEIPDEIFAFETVGLTAGASTPDFMVDEVEHYLLSGPRSNMVG